MTDEELLGEIEAQRNQMIAVATGGPPIDRVDGEYRARRGRVQAALQAKGIENPNPYDSLWDWYGKWSSGDLPTYQSRRQYISGLFGPLIQGLQAHAQPGARSARNGLGEGKGMQYVPFRGSGAGAGVCDCPICGRDAKSPPPGPWSYGRLLEGYQCDVCGLYGFTTTAGAADLRGLPDDPDKAYRVASIIREANLRGKKPLLYTHPADDEDNAQSGYPIITVDEALAKFPQTLSERTDRTLTNIFRLQGDFDKRTVLERDRDHPVCFARDGGAMFEYIEALERKGRLKTIAPTRGSVRVKLTWEEWERIEGSENRPRNAKHEHVSGTESDHGPLRVFLCHASEDKQAVRQLYSCLRDDGFDPWLDEENLLPGQDWDFEVRKAVRSSDVVLVCLSSRAVTKKGFVQKEIKLALDVADEQPEGAIFIIPVRLEACDVPERLKGRQWVDLFNERGYDNLRRALESKRDDAYTTGG